MLNGLTSLSLNTFRWGCFAFQFHFHYQTCHPESCYPCLFFSFSMQSSRWTSCTRQVGQDPHKLALLGFSRKLRGFSLQTASQNVPGSRTLQFQPKIWTLHSKFQTGVFHRSIKGSGCRGSVARRLAKFRRLSTRFRVSLKHCMDPKNHRAFSLNPHHARLFHANRRTELLQHIGEMLIP